MRLVVTRAELLVARSTAERPGRRLASLRPLVAARVMACLLMALGLLAGCSANGQGGSKLEISSNRDGDVVATSLVIVSGTAPSGSTITRDIAMRPDVHATADGSGHWQMPVSLKEGDNRLTFRIADERSTALTLTITYHKPKATPRSTATSTRPTEVPVPTPAPTATPERDANGHCCSDRSVRGGRYIVSLAANPDTQAHRDSDGQADPDSDGQADPDPDGQAHARPGGDPRCALRHRIRVVVPVRVLVRVVASPRRDARDLAMSDDNLAICEVIGSAGAISQVDVAFGRIRRKRAITRALRWALSSLRTSQRRRRAGWRARPGRRQRKARRSMSPRSSVIGGWRSSPAVTRRLCWRLSS